MKHGAPFMQYVSFRQDMLDVDIVSVYNILSIDIPHATYRHCICVCHILIEDGHPSSTWKIPLMPIDHLT